jgi:hypothetical protein
MKAILFAIMGLVLLIGLFLLYIGFLRRQFAKTMLIKSAALNPLKKKLKLNETISDDELVGICQEPSLRPAILHLLKDYHREHLFPADYMTVEKGAESYFVSWLEFPTELGTKPHHIEFLEKVILIERETIDYYVFKFMARSSQWVTQQWMIGACGPYHAKSLPYDIPSRIYSRFKTLGTTTPESEVLWIHANVKNGPFS